MNVCILGWYGTETLGDRAILDGIIRIYNEVENESIFYIGSLHPLLTERTIIEDKSLYEKYCPNIGIFIFDVRNKAALKKHILKADTVIMGGGPLMPIHEMAIIEKAFKYAKKNNKKTALIGCGYEGACRKSFAKSLKSIVKHSDLVIMRSRTCRDNIIELCGETVSKKVFYSLDPAIISVIEYSKDIRHSNENYWIMNIRDLDYVYQQKQFYYSREKKLVEMVCNQVEKLVLVPMHSFSIGGDDRFIQNRVAIELNRDNLSVIQKPLSLEQMYICVAEAKGCIGMRYHSIVLQSFLNGNNYIINYTDMNKGKIKAFLKDIDINNFYGSRFVDILKDDSINLCDEVARFQYDKTISTSSIAFYKTLILEKCK